MKVTNDKLKGRGREIEEESVIIMDRERRPLTVSHSNKVRVIEKGGQPTRQSFPG